MSTVQKPLLPAPLIPFALAMGGMAIGAGVFIEDAARWLTPLGSIFLFMGGLGLRVPEWAAVRRLVPLTLVPMTLGLSRLLQSPEGLPIPAAWYPMAQALAGLLSLLAGQVLPPPVHLGQAGVRLR